MVFRWGLTQGLWQQMGMASLIFMKKDLVPGCTSCIFFFFLKMGINKTGASPCTSEFYKKIALNLAKITIWNCFQHMANFAWKKMSLWSHSLWNVWKVMFWFIIPYQQFFKVNLKYSQELPVNLFCFKPGPHVVNFQSFPSVLALE